ncbi:hypothetical protein AB0D29_22395 [Streptomyces sp. NPDC048424]|uniref:hypothetical protein n=1 Tax=Streptomyces sp. NPDC048424 TaxID=3155265 RepID=UPI00343BB4C8
MRRGTVLAAVAAAGCGLTVLAAASCAPPPAPPLSPEALISAAPSLLLPPSPVPSTQSVPPSPASPSPASPSAVPAAPEAPSTSGPASPVGEGQVTPADAPLLEAVRRHHPGARAQADDSIIVIHREPAAGAGEFVWMPDDRHYCLVVVRGERTDLTCRPLPAFWARIGIRLVTKGGLYPGESGDPAASGTRTVFFAVVDGGHGPYRYAGSASPGPDAGPVRDATAVFASGRTLSLLTYERPSADLAPRGGPDICSTDNAVCFPALDAYVG